MKLVLCELRKLCASRAVSSLLLILLALNFELTYFASRPMPVERAAREVYALYLEDPAGLAEYKERLEADFFEHLRDDEFEVPSTYAEGVDDMSVIHRVLERAEYLRDYRAEMLKIAESAERRASELGYLGYPEESFYVREQQRLAKVYSSLAEALEEENEYAYGYDAYSGNFRVCLFLALWLLFAVSFIFLNDGVCGFGSIMRTARRGRLSSSLAKLAAAVTVSVGSTLLFSVTAFIATASANGGLSSATVPIQIFPDYARVPLEVSVLGFLGIQTAYRIIAAVLFSLFVALIASLGFNYVFCFAFGAVFAAANYFVFVREYQGSAPAIRYLNIASAAEGRELLSFCRNAELFGYPVSYTALLLLISAVSAVVLSALCAFFCSKNLKVPMPDLKGIALRSDKKKEKRELRVRPLLPLWVYELQKNRFLPISLSLLLLLAARCAFASASVGSGATYGEAIYYGYIDDIKELSEEERGRYLSRERASLEAVLSEYKPMTESYESGEVEYEDYASFLREYYKAKELERALLRVEDYSAYAARRGCGVIYDTGYEELFAIGTDWFLFAALVIPSVGIFAVEYRAGNCAQVVRTAKKGRKATFFSKLLPYSVMGALLGAAFRTACFIVTACNYELSELDSELCSIRTFEAVPSGISIGCYLVVDLVLSAFAGALIACTVCLISCVCKRTLPSLGAVGVVLAFPAFLIENGTALVGLTAPCQAICTAGGSVARLALTLVLHLSAVSVFGIIAAKVFCGYNKKAPTR